MNLIVATRNRGKLAEFEALLRGCPNLCFAQVGDPLRDYAGLPQLVLCTSWGPLGIRLLSLTDYPAMPEIPENGADFLENALIKARATCEFTGLPALADDSGLEVDALGGLPGVRSARFAPTQEERNAKLLDLMRDVPDDRRTARFVCALALVRPDCFEWTTVGVCGGIITRAPSGAGGFGYDPLFLYPPLGLTFAEIPLAEKNRISHRGRALSEFRKALISLGMGVIS